MPNDIAADDKTADIPLVTNILPLTLTPTTNNDDHGSLFFEVDGHCCCEYDGGG